MPNFKSLPRLLQQQPKRNSDPQQQQAGSTDFQPKPGSAKPPQMGEGSYEATRDYQKGLKDYLKDADVQADAQAAKPANAQEAREMEKAEEEGKSHSRGER